MNNPNHPTWWHRISILQHVKSTCCKVNPRGSSLPMSSSQPADRTDSGFGAWHFNRSMSSDVCLQVSKLSFLHGPPQSSILSNTLGSHIPSRIRWSRLPKEMHKFCSILHKCILVLWPALGYDRFAEIFDRDCWDQVPLECCISDCCHSLVFVKSWSQRCWWPADTGPNIPNTYSSTVGMWNAVLHHWFLLGI